MNDIEKIIKDVTLTYEQKVLSLARYAENSVNVLNIPEETQKLRDAGIICDLFEGNAPYRPRYRSFFHLIFVLYTNKVYHNKSIYSTLIKFTIYI